MAQCIVSRSPFRHTLYAGYTDGTIGYVPTRAAYAEGGYEATHACRVAPEAGEQIERGRVGAPAQARPRRNVSENGRVVSTILARTTEDM
jgi:hypothetical protein